MVGNTAKAKRMGRRVAAQERQARVLRLKVTGASDREIARQLTLDPVNPVRISHVQVNRDWHAALDRDVADNMEEARDLRALAHARLERLLMAHWMEATRLDVGGADPAAAELCRRLIADISRLYGLNAIVPIVAAVEGRSVVEFRVIYDDGDPN